MTFIINNVCKGMTKFMRFLNDEDGVTAIEYGLIAALVGVAILVTVFAIGDSLVSLFTGNKNDLDVKP